MKFLVYQIIGMGIIWIGLAYFYQDMDQLSKIVFYLVTSWLLLLIVLLIKQTIKGDGNKDKSE
ncbi:hypothetical protein FH966_07750 [Lentibacillus cibarius]|uniref:Uncharacterized protein n=1 Tax=Lentibacillus cibarius TaxID=2583219 RepID=A0A549YMY7_9BACI|nr:hypothetical protein FH966_07750 [Lentibacillus cibarius]